MFRVAIIVAAAALAGCQTQTAGTATPGGSYPTVQRIDGRRAATHPEIIPIFKQDTTICSGEANKAAASAPLTHRGLDLTSNLMADKVESDQRKYIERVYLGCMAARGYERSDNQATVKVTY
ncbi:hypothetical protein [Bosea sp. (in: a-proteobacteria)]|uniref:hypothetical protein n=1 Tax=Bosea sp. (in: a-proteobacteria) TaxID=1871050 RepID=UPI0026197093|nr:hypothetical protein [Bosea sp. (in: a-proteobacteria)]MCO5090876.1 hypothetical protein [Bosea sp. (in: a-proteobacteria)]